ncbi:MAG TPA: sortase [Candidatus Saccharimonadales bacterium]|nr:sortase [Candidatus Saccharimonadales bacterium]
MADEDEQKHNDQFDAALPLPINHSQKPQAASSSGGSDATADLIRKKIEAAYAKEPSAQAEEEELEKTASKKLSKHQRFILDLTSSGKPLHEVQIAWHEYYAALPDNQKHEVWEEFYKTHAETSHYQAITHTHKDQKSHAATEEKRSLPPTTTASRSIQNFRNSLKTPEQRAVGVKKQSPLHSILFGLAIGCIVLVIFLFSFFNERFITPFIQPSRDVSATPLIIGTQAVGQSPQLIIPKINVQIPIIYATDNSDNTIENDLESGVVHYADTAMPGQDGNLVIFGHSSNNIFNPGKYKFAFVLLSRLENGDTFYVDNGGKRYTYEVFGKKIVPPSDVNVLGPVANKTATATLITCDPPGTSLNRLVVSADQIDPNPTSNIAASADTGKAAQNAKAIAGNGPTLWQRLWHAIWD